MSVKIYVDVKVAVFMLLDYGLLGRIDGRLPFRVWVQIESVQIVIIRVKPEIPSRHAIWIQQWDNFEDIVLQKDP
jgi:hypothetical protein